METRENKELIVNKNLWDKVPPKIRNVIYRVGCLVGFVVLGKVGDMDFKTEQAEAKSIEQFTKEQTKLKKIEEVNKKNIFFLENIDKASKEFKQSFGLSNDDWETLKNRTIVFTAAPEYKQYNNIDVFVESANTALKRRKDSLSGNQKRKLKAFLLTGDENTFPINMSESTQ